MGESDKNPKAWVVSVNMGYGHQRTAFPLRHLSMEGKAINANDYSGIPFYDRIVWEGTRKVYEFISRLKGLFLVGELIFSFFNFFQKILNFYPRRNLSNPNFQLREIFSMINVGWGRHLIKKLEKNSLPFVTTFSIPAFMAEHFQYPNDVYCVICDADIARPWVAYNPFKSRIKYFAPNSRVVERLKMYGVKPANIFLTGYPLPLENIGGEEMEILKEDLGYRLLNLDPKRKFFQQYRALIEKNLGGLPQRPDHVLTIMFSLGGAGAQREIGLKILKEFSYKIKQGTLRLVLSVGINKKAKEFFLKKIKGLGLENEPNILVLYCPTIEEYFTEFNLQLRKTDILWTKPSELSFYSGLGLPIIIAPPVGSQEDFNKRWLLKSGFGLAQENPSIINQWLFDWLENGYLAEAAMEGFIECPKMGALEIEKIISS
jgi:hypothetical protein